MQLYKRNKARGIAKPSAKIYIAIAIVQVTQVKITHAIHQLLDFDACGLVNLVVFVITVRGRALHGQPLPIPDMYQHLLPWVQAVCTAKVDLLTCVVYLHARQGKAKFNFKLHLVINTTQLLQFCLQTMLCFVNFDSQQPAVHSILKVTLHQLFDILVRN